MTVSAQTPINRSTGNGVTTVFPYTFKIISSADMEVSVDGVVKTLTVDYTLSGVGDDAGGTVTMTTAPASGTTVVRRRNMALTRSTDYQDQGTLPAATLDNDIDATVLMVQQLEERLDRTFSLPASFSGDSTLPAPQAGYLLGWDATAENLTNIPATIGTSLVDLAAPPGSSLVGYSPEGIGSLPTTLQEVARDAISVFRFLTAAEVTDVKARTYTLQVHAGVQAGITHAALVRKKLFCPAGGYLLGDGLSHTTPNEAYANYPDNGVQIEGEAGTVFKASAAFPLATAMLNLDGNPANSEVVSAFCVSGSRVDSIEFHGNNRAERGLRLRGVVHSNFENLYFHDFAGNVNHAVLYIAGVTTPTKDDADATFACRFANIRIRGSLGFGISAINNRCGGISFADCDIRDCSFDGMRMAFANLALSNVTIAGCGNLANTTTGGFSATAGATGALNRGLSIVGCQFENNFWHDVNINYCYGFSITGCISNPYQSDVTATTQAAFKFGTLNAVGGLVSGNRIQEYSHTFGYDIKQMDFGSGAKDIALFGNSLEDAAAQYTMNAAATGITKDGVSICATHNIPSFMCWGTTNAAAAAVLVNNTDFYTGGAAGSYFNAAGVTVDHNNGGHLTTTGDATGGIFTAPEAGFYEFGIKFTARGFDVTQTGMEVALIKNLGGAAQRYVVTDTQLDGYTAGDTEQFGGTLQIKLAKGDTIVGAIKVTGGAANASIDRVKQGAFTFYGRAF